VVSKTEHERLKKRYEKLLSNSLTVDEEIGEIFSILKVLDNRTKAIQKYQTELKTKMMKQ